MFISPLEKTTLNLVSYKQQYRIWRGARDAIGLSSVRIDTTLHCNIDVLHGLDESILNEEQSQPLLSQSDYGVEKSRDKTVTFVTRDQ